MAKQVEQVHDVVIRFAGDSGDGMQLTGGRFTSETAALGNDLSTLPDYPAEIRAPAGSLPGVSGFQIHFSDHDILTPGDRPDVLVAMNPAALRTNLEDLPSGGTLILNRDAFTDKNLQKAGYSADPLEDGSLEEYKLHSIPLTSMTVEALKGIDGVTSREAERSKNFFALGLMSWLYGRPTENTHEFIQSKFAKRPEIAEANRRAFNAGYNYGETSEDFLVQYEVQAAPMAPGLYRQITGNQALAYGLIAASVKSGLPLFLGAYPITPASGILEELAHHKEFGVRTFQAEDEIAAVGAALGASFGGSLGVCTSAGPGVVLKAETVGLAMMLELPLLIIDVQRAGPSTGMPTKPEQADLLMVLYGRNSENPVPVIAASTPGDCFDCALEAIRIAIKYRTPVYLLSDAYLANGSEPWLIPDIDAIPPLDVDFATAAARGRRLPPVRARPRHARAAVGDPRHARPRASHRRAREAGRHGQRLVRPRQPRQDGSAARAEGRGHRRRHPRPLRRRPERRRRAARALVGRLVRAGARRRDPRAQGRAERRARARPLPEPVPAEHGRGARALPEGARSGDEPRPAAQARARRVPRRRDRLQPCARASVPRAGDPRRNRGDAVSDGNGNLIQLTAKDFKSDQEVRWCPGCGDYAILAAMQGFMPELGLARENIVFVSGIGCAARFPYYMQSYGMHSIHGRAPAIATGLATSRPDLSVWVVTGDGDALSIGGNHLIHALRRNVNVKILMFNNEIYGLTKGQYSPTSPVGKRTGSTPMGSIDNPFNPLSLAIGTDATFVARAMDTDRKELTEVLRAAAAHKGASFVEIFQNCNIYNDGAFDAVREDKTNRIYLRHGEPVRFGEDGTRGVRLREDGSVEVFEGEGDALVWDAHHREPSIAFAMSRLTLGAVGAAPFGVFRDVERPVYDEQMAEQLDQARAAKGEGDLAALVASGDTWSIGEPPIDRSEP